MIVLPIALQHRLSEDEMDTVLMHELAHIRRRDHLIRWFELIITVLYWWNPVVWWARRELRKAEEECCDAWVQREFPKKTNSYASALLETAEFLRREKTVVPVMCNAFGAGETLKRRVEMILKQTSDVRLSWPLRLGILLVAALTLPLSAQSVDDANDTSVTTLVQVKDAKAAEMLQSLYKKVNGVVDVDHLIGHPQLRTLQGEADKLLGSLSETQVTGEDELKERVKELETQIESLVRELEVWKL